MMIKETATERAAVREFWAFLEAELAKQPRKACHLPQLVAVLIDDYRYLAPLILLDAQQDPCSRRDWPAPRRLASPRRCAGKMGSGRPTHRLSGHRSSDHTIQARMP